MSDEDEFFDKVNKGEEQREELRKKFEALHKKLAEGKIDILSSSTVRDAWRSSKGRYGTALKIVK